MVALLLCVTAVGALAATTTTDRQETAFAQPSSAQDGPCEITASREVAPRVAELGGEVSITMSVRTRCLVSDRPLHLVLLVDASQGMGGGRLDEARRALESALRRLDLGARDDVRVGVVSFAENAVPHSPLNNDVDRIAADLNNIVLGGEGRLGDGIAESLRALRAARPGRGPGPPREVVLLISGGEVRCDDVRDEARNLLETQDIVLTTACRGRECLIGCLPLALRRYNYELPAWEAVFEPLEDLFSSRGPFLPIGRVLMHDELSLQLRYAGGGDPTGGSGNVLTWSIERWPAEGMTVTYRAEVLECGEFSSAEPGESKVEVEYAAPLFPRTREIFPLPDSRLTVPCAPPTPSPPPPGTPSPGPTASPTATRPAPTESSPTPRPATPTPWPPGLMRRAWLPLLTSGACLTEHAALDLVIVADVSGSMSIADVPGFENRWDLARALVLATIYGGDGAAGLRPGIDRVGLVAFGGASSPLVSLPLEPCCDEERRAQIETFWKIDGSDFARGLRQASALFSTAAPRAASRELLLVTDGDLDTTAPEALDASLAALDQAGVTRHVVGVGGQVERAVLARLAGAGRRVHRAADHPASALPRALADVVRCLR